MDRRPSPHRENWAAWVSLPVVWPGWIAGRTPRGFHHRLFGRDGSPAEPPPGELGRVGFITGCLAGMDRRSNAVWVLPPAVMAPTWPGTAKRSAGQRPRAATLRSPPSRLATAEARSSSNHPYVTGKANASSPLKPFPPRGLRAALAALRKSGAKRPRPRSAILDDEQPNTQETHGSEHCSLPAISGESVGGFSPFTRR